MVTSFSVLFIDDDPDEHEIFAIALLHSFPTSHCSFFFDIPSAVIKLNEEKGSRPDFIFIDWYMPAMDTEEGLKTLCGMDGMHNTGIFILSGTTYFYAEMPYLTNLGVKKVLTKQNTINLLAEELKAAIHGPNPQLINNQFAVHNAGSNNAAYLL